jgi:hypothetical protein
MSSRELPGAHMKIEVLYFDGCPNHKPAIELVHQVLQEVGVPAEVAEVNVPDAATAESQRFLGSPSIRVDGLDVEPAARTAREYALSCRTYFTNGRIEGLPSRDLVRQAVTGACDRSADRAPAPPFTDPACCPAPGSRNELHTSSPRSHTLVMAGSVIAAIAASLCCTLPIIFALTGFSILGASAYFNTLRPYLLVVTFALLGLAFYYAYRPLPQQSACAPGTACAPPVSWRSARIVLWLVTALVIAMAAFPYYSGPVAEFLLASGS